MQVRKGAGIDAFLPTVLAGGVVTGVGATVAFYFAGVREKQEQFYQAIEADGHSAEFTIALHDPVRYEFQKLPGVSFANARVAPNSVCKHT